jgi:hypothetical protein
VCVASEIPGLGQGRGRDKGRWMVGRGRGGEVGRGGFGPNAHFSEVGTGPRAWLWGWVGEARDLVVRVR